MNRLKLYISSIFIILNIYTINSQELVLTGLGENPVIRKYVSEHPNVLRQRATIDTLSLPFFDDFAKNDIFPDQKLWLDKDVFINTSYGDDPPSIGVASFDAIDSAGYIYSNANATSFIGDYLTSKPINLEDLSESDSVFLSFFIQPQGFAGIEPAYKDSIVLEFKDTNLIWNSVWRKTGSANTEFKQILIQLSDIKYLFNGFQFRFLNYASLGNSMNSWHSNCDIWNLDYVYVDTSRSATDTIYDDVSLVYPVQSPLNNYNSMPWNHYKNDNTEMLDSITIEVKNLYDEQLPFSSLFSIANLTENDLGSEEQFGSDNVDVNSSFSLSVSDSVHFNTSSSDSALFEIKTYLNSDTNDVFPQFHWNDTARYYQKFYNYYAYDDGTPEFGVGLSGNNSDNGMMAIQYNTYVTDTLRALQIFFNHTKEEVNFTFFHLMVWDDNNGQPGDVIYEQENTLAEYTGFNHFKNYLLDTLLIVSDVFYIGWQKAGIFIEEEMMNIGLDLSVDNKDKTFYSFNNGLQWDNSPFSGSIMIRPVFGKDISSVNVPIISHYNNNFNIYPNPSSDYIYFDKYALDKINPEHIYIYNTWGELIYQSNKITEKIDVSKFKSGMYFIKISNHSRNSTQSRFIVTH